MTTITHSTGQIVPTIVDGYEARREVRNVIHPILGNESPSVTFRPAGLRRGSLRCVFADRVAAQAAFGVLATGQVFTLADADVPTLDMSFVVDEGDLTIHLDDLTRSAWVVTVPFQEVAP